MTTEQLQKAISAQPFQPFKLRTADGNEYNVPHREFIMYVPGTRTVVVADSDGSVDVLDLLLIASLSTGPKNGRRRR